MMLSISFFIIIIRSSRVEIHQRPPKELLPRPPSPASPSREPPGPLHAAQLIAYSTIINDIEGPAFSFINYFGQLASLALAYSPQLSQGPGKEGGGAQETNNDQQSAPGHFDTSNRQGTWRRRSQPPPPHTAPSHQHNSRRQTHHTKRTARITGTRAARRRRPPPPPPGGNMR